MPGASDEKLRALVYREIRIMKHGKKEEVDPELTLKPNISRSVASKAPGPVDQKKLRKEMIAKQLLARQQAT